MKKAALLLLVLLIAMGAQAQTEEGFSATRETNTTSSPTSTVDVIHIYNPPTSGKMLKLDRIVVSGTSTVGYDVWIINIDGSGCPRNVQVKHQKLDKTKLSVAQVRGGNCAVRPTPDPEWWDGPLYQFITNATGRDLNTNGLEIPPGKGIVVRTDTPGNTAGNNMQVILFWRE